ncbi:DUF421 domain-containing protein [Costertonia aggregata]|uniref:DUF421 domain-containing protein n=1 Tax=Costertonia aggregata TaxID=343403 RepID=A0A7H9ASV7_9FLAO|nr:YetF domain-containing protein [Costertonia aggregata]QLG46516.1 DUF421 domain-containing protein [Costertonia aggregata]
MENYFGTTFGPLAAICISAFGIFVVIIVLTRLSGKRSFSKMSSFDFASTIAIGSIIASGVISPSVTLTHAAIGLAAIFGIQSLVARLRLYKPFRNAVDNDPLLLMDGKTILHKNLKKANVTEGDLRAKLREANVLDLSQVRAVVFETTGDIAVLHTADADQELKDWLLKWVGR